MALTPEWRGRVEQWRNTIEQLAYEKLGDVPLEGFATLEQLTPRQALSQRFRRMATGASWGAKWEYLWVRGGLRAPREAAGGQLVLRTHDVGGHSGDGRVLINGVEAGGRDGQHQDILLAAKARPGTRYDVLIELYAGHGATPCGGGPSPEGHLTVPEPPAEQRQLLHVSYGLFSEDCYQAWIDLCTLLEIRDLQDPNSLRTAEIDNALREFTLAVDPELPRREMIASVREGRKRLAGALARHNGSTAPLMWCFGHSHIDVAWLWPLAETERKCARTFATQLALMDQYPEFRYLQSQPHLYRMTQRLYPELYARIKASARRGQWIAEGGMWVEADTNITGGESLIRQFIHGKRFYREEFGVNSRLMWLPDVFGYSGAMPQIMAGCGIDYFSTQKIFWTYNGGEPFPYNTFWWEGIDGTRVLSHLHNDYNSQTNPASLKARWDERRQKNELVGRMVPFGYGDGGGGPTRNHLEFLRRQADLQGAPRVKFASPVDYLRAEEKRGVEWPVFVGELYFQAHRGTYTTQARTKRGNRLGELALREAEMWGAAALARAGFKYPYAAMDSTWKDLLLNQFHDIIPGSSIGRVYEEAEALHREIIADARATAAAAVRRLGARRARAVTALNSLSWDRRALVPLPKGWRGATLEGKPLPAQRVGATTCVEAVLPSCGWITLERGRAAAVPNALKVTPRGMENEHLRLTLNARGEIAGLVDKATRRQIAAGPMNQFRMFKDVPRWFEAWDIDSTYKFQPVALGGTAEIEVVAGGPLAGVLRVTRTLGRSRLVQEIRLRADSRRIDFATTIDWQEKHKLLKVAFPTALHAGEAIHEIQFGHLRRPNHASMPFDADRFEVANQKWTALAEENGGAAVLNDCKYGVNVEGGCISLTLLRATLAPDMRADRGLQEFTYAFHCWNGPFFGSNVVREGYDLNVPPMVSDGAAGRASLFRVDAPNVVIESVKPAEDRSGDVVVRLYESLRAATDCVLTTELPVRSAAATDMLEGGASKLPLRGNALRLSFRPFEIKTLRFTCPG